MEEEETEEEETKKNTIHSSIAIDVAYFPVSDSQFIFLGGWETGSSLHATWQMSKTPPANMINYSGLLRCGQVIGDNKYAIRFMQL